MTDTNTPSSFWRPCMKRPVVVHVRDATPGEEVFTREGLTIAKDDDLVMRGIDGEVYPIGRSIFERTYDLMPDGAAVADAAQWLDSQTWNVYAMIPTHEARRMATEYGARVLAAAVVADPPELAQARERIAALEAEAVQLRAHALGCHSDYDEVVRQRDAALARVAALEAAAPAPTPAQKCTCSEDLRMAAGMLRRVSRVDDPKTPERCRIAAGYDAAAAFLDSPGVTPIDPREGT